MLLETDELELALWAVAEARLDYQDAERDLAAQGIRVASPADVMAWRTATPKRKRQLAQEWASLLAMPDPDFKPRNNRK